MRKYNKPHLEVNVFQTIDVLTTSDNSALNNIAQNLASEGARTQAYDFSELFD